jgi:hypothetical protein
MMIILLVLGFTLSSCGGGGGGGGSTSTDTTTTTTSVNVSFSSSIQPIFNNRCITNCHVSGGSSSFLPLNSGVSRANLVNQSSTRSGGGTLVIPGDAANSILYKRINGTSAGIQMPQNGSPLSQDDQQLIRVWIDEGAKDN